jgi:hypothetical protein
MHYLFYRIGMLWWREQQYDVGYYFRFFKEEKCDECNGEDGGYDASEEADDALCIG